MSDDAIPTSYEQWRNFIEVRGGIPLTRAYVAGRLRELQNEKHATTRAFTKLYGDDHLQRTIAWFRRAADELAEGRK